MGTILSPLGAYGQGHAQAEASHYNALVAWNNAKIAKENQSIVSQAGEAQTGMAGERSRAAGGAIKTNQAASGVSVNSGSAVDTQTSARELGNLDAMTVRSNAVKEAYGYKVQSENFNTEGEFLARQAKSEEAGAIVGAATTFIGSAENDYSTYLKWQQAGGL